ncbi:hypothetical protein J3A83DRAFT_4089539 [Scleroderma citrinum]
MRVKVTTSPPLPPLKAWFPIPSSSTTRESTIASFKSHLCRSLPILREFTSSSLSLSIDGFQLLDDSEIEVVRDGDLVWLTNVSIEQICPPRHDKSPSSSSSSSPSSSSDTTSTSSEDSDSDSSSESDSGIPLVIQEVPLVPPGFGKPQTRARNRRRRLKRQHERGATALVPRITSGVNAIGPPSEVTPSPQTTIPPQEHDPNGKYHIEWSEMPDDNILSLPSLSLRNKNKAKNFRSFIGKPLPPKIIFADEEMKRTPTQLEPSSETLRPPAIDSQLVPFMPILAAVEPRATRILPSLIPPSSRPSLPPNLFVTSVDVEAGLHRPKKKRKTRAAAEYGAKVAECGYYRPSSGAEEAEDDVAECSIVLDYSDDKYVSQQNSPCKGNAYFSNGDVDSLERSTDSNWAGLRNISREMRLNAGNIVAYKVSTHSSCLPHCY